ncbi:hypothetical protein [Microbacterium lacus]|uniref:Uncharacterized protein n=1 Tax=Microbacterium lacus TaxID=415217 RepID=A0ABP4SW85_9MICO
MAARNATHETIAIHSQRSALSTDPGAFHPDARPPATHTTPALKKLFAELDRNNTIIGTAEQELLTIEANWIELEAEATRSDARDAANANRNGTPFTPKAVKELRGQRQNLIDTIAASNGARKLIEADLAAERERIQNTGNAEAAEQKQREKVRAEITRLHDQINQLGEAIAWTNWVFDHTPWDTTIRFNVAHVWPEISVRGVTGTTIANHTEVLNGLADI